MSENRVLVIATDQATNETTCAVLGAEGMVGRAVESVGEALSVLDRQPALAVVVWSDAADISDWSAIVRRPMGPPVVVVSREPTVEQAVGAMRAGAADFVAAGADAKGLSRALARICPVQASPSLIAEDAATIGLADLAKRVAPKAVTVLLTGESGTGKEVFARHIHEHSTYSSGPFVPVNCAAIPENMLEAVLFGYEKGAFTGAVRSHAGKFEQAQGGTLLLDEVSEIDLGLQAKLLRVLQEREVERLCGTHNIPLQTRVLATTNRDLRAEVEAGRFREDLYYRLHVFPMHLPPLRSRRDDVRPLAEAFLRRYGRGQGVESFSAGALRALLNHDWPGNVRELENVVQRALVLTDGIQVPTEAVCFEPAERPAAPAPSSPDSLQDDLRTREQRLILETLDRLNGSRKGTAERLGISVRTLRYKLARMRDAGMAVPEGA